MQTMLNELTKITSFHNWDEHQATEYKIQQLVNQGRLYECGLSVYESVTVTDFLAGQALGGTERIDRAALGTSAILTGIGTSGLARNIATPGLNATFSRAFASAPPTSHTVSPGATTIHNSAVEARHELGRIVRQADAMDPGTLADHFAGTFSGGR